MAVVDATIVESTTRAGSERRNSEKNARFRNSLEIRTGSNSARGCGLHEKFSG